MSDLLNTFTASMLAFVLSTLVEAALSLDPTLLVKAADYMASLPVVYPSRTE